MNGNLPTLSATVVAGAVLGALGVLLLIGGPSVDETKRFSKAPESRSLRVDEVISTSAESQRQDGYADIQSVADALALPDDFSRREALYVLAGRSNAAEVQDLVYQATDLVDATQRYASVAILLERLVALDPRSAVAIAGGPRLSESRHFENAAWASWSRNDPEAAIAAAAALAGTARWRAVQGVYVGYGVSHVDAPGHILKATGVEPGRQAVANMVSLFAATDVKMAVEAIELLPRNPPIPYQAIGSLAYYAAQNPGALASIRFKHDKLQQDFAELYERQVATLYPEQHIQRLLNDPGADTTDLSNAVIALAKADPKRAMRYVEQLGPNARSSVVPPLAKLLLASDVEAALAWARENDKSRDGAGYRSVLAELALSDIDLALREVDRLDSEERKVRAIQEIARLLASKDPAKSRDLFDQLPPSAARGTDFYDALRLAAYYDVDAAMTWYRSLEDTEKESARMHFFFGVIVDNNAAAAAELLADADEKEFNNIASNIANEFADSRTFDGAIGRIEEFRANPRYEDLLTMLLTRLSSRYPERANEHAERELSGDNLEKVRRAAKPRP